MLFRRQFNFVTSPKWYLLNRIKSTGWWDFVVRTKTLKIIASHTLVHIEERYLSSLERVEHKRVTEALMKGLFVANL